MASAETKPTPRSGFSANRLEIFSAALSSTDVELLSQLKSTDHADISKVLQNAPKSALTDSGVSRLKLANLVAEAANDDVALASAVLGDPQVTTSRKIALTYGLQRLKTIASKSQSTPQSREAAPAPQSSSISDQAPSPSQLNSAAIQAAVQFRRRLFEEEPTAVLRQMIASDDEAENPSENLPVHSDGQIRLQVAKFLDDRPNFNIRTQSILAEIAADEKSPKSGTAAHLGVHTRRQVFGSLKLLQRVQALAPAPEAMEPLINSGMTSALRVSSLPKDRFVNAMTTKIATSAGVNRQEASRLASSIHDHAVLSRARTDSALLQIHQALRGSGLTAIDGTSNLTERKNVFTHLADEQSGSQGIVDLDDLFHDMDFCECDSCQDVTSPTAYYVDLLQYLRNNNLDTTADWPNTGQEGYKNTVLEKLFIRRPDLQHLKLTCENANTVLPYIDLSNEIMESFVIHLETYAQGWTRSKQVSLETWNIEDEDTNELLASPSHTRKPAYCILNEAVFPVANLPYFQPLDAMRLYLQYLGVTRHKLIDTFRLAKGQWRVRASLLTQQKRPLFIQLRNQLQDRAATAEYLGFSPNEYIIIARESIWPIKCSLFSDNGNLLTLDEYLTDIGVRSPEAYWGYESSLDMLSNDPDDRKGLTWVKAQFLRRAGLSYAETVDLVRTYYVNPMFPSGRAKILLDGIKFSYRFLQHLAAIFSDLSSRNDAITNFLFITQPWVQVIQTSQQPPTGNALILPKSPPSFSRKEINSWVSRWFECIGKLVVLDSGQGPMLPVRGYVLYVPAKIESSVTMDDLTTAVKNAPNATESVSGTDVPSSGIIVLGYLESDGGIFDPSNKIIGLVDMGGKVLYQDWKPIRTHYPEGHLAVLDVPRTINGSTSPVGDVEHPPLIVGTINSDSFIEINQGTADVAPVLLKWIIPPESCSIENTRLVHLNGNPLEPWEWDRINRFIRLYKKLQMDSWSIAEVDICLKGLWKTPEIAIPDPPSGTPPPDDGESFSFSKYQDKGCGCSTHGEDECDCDDSGDDCGGDDQGQSPCDPSNFVNISPGFLRELKSVKELALITGIRDKLFSFWSDIDSFGDGSLFARLFVTHNLKNIDPVFQPDDNGNYFVSEPKISEHVPVLVAALQIKASLFDAALEKANLKKTDVISIPNLSKLYRLTLLARVLGMNFANLLNSLDLFVNPFSSASRTLDVYQLWSRISAVGLSLKQLRYIILDINDPLLPVGPSKVTILKSTKTILDGLSAINLANPDLPSEQEGSLTAQDVKVKATLIFAPAVVETISGIIEGTTLYTTNAPTGQSVDKTKLSDKILYNDAVPGSGMSAPRRATLSVKGVLTDQEQATAVSMFPGNDSWKSAFDRLKKQAVNRVKSTLASVYLDKIDDAVTVLTKGDVPETPPASDTDVGDPGTALEKRVNFIRALMPIVRSYLGTQLIVTTMSGVTSLSPEMTSLLLNKIIAVGPIGSEIYGMEILKGLAQHLSSPPSGTWTGFLIPASTDVFSFYINSETQPAPFSLDGKTVAFLHQNEDPNDIWWTEPVSLTGGRLYTLSTVGQKIPGDLQWKTDRSGVVTIPASSLIPDASISDATDVFLRLSKASMLIQAFNLGVAEVDYLQAHKLDFAGLNFNAMTFEVLVRLLSYVELRDSLPKREKTLVDLFQWASQVGSATGEEISTQISNVVGIWDKNQVMALIDAQIFDLTDPALFRNEIPMRTIAKAIGFMQDIAISDLNLLLSWTDLKLDFNPTWSTAKSILSTIRGKYSLEDFEQAIKPSHDQLRKNQRDALIAYLVVQSCLQKWGVKDADGLFEFFLLDVQMGSCMQTSRTKQAISSVQQFVQRCMLGLEENKDPNVHVPNDALDATRWQWMSKQTIWTANRKVFLYPENWLIPSLRDDKTPVYTTMEGDMLQKDLNPPNILESFKGFVANLDQISHLRAVGLHVEETTTTTYILHCIGMTPGSPFLFFYRTFDSSVHEWKPWSQIQADIPTYTQQYRFPRSGEEMPRTSLEILNGCYTVPFVWASRILLFIGQISQKAVPNDSALDTDFGELTKPNSTTSATDLAPSQCWEIKVAFTEFRSGRWSQKAISADSLLTTPDKNLSPTDSFQFFPRKLVDANGIEYISIEVWQCDQDPMIIRAETNKGDFIGEFVFNGSIISKGGKLQGSIDKPSNWIATNFHLVAGRSPGPTASSFQKNTDGTLPYFNKAPCVKYSVASPATAALDQNGVVYYDATNTDLFFHPFTSRLLGAGSLSTDKIDPILQVLNDPAKMGKTIASAAFGVGPNESGADGQPRPTFSELSRPYSNYNWELGFHGPMQIAQNLLNSQQFDSALEMIHQVFNPYADGKDATRVWQWYPFKVVDSTRVLETILDRLKPREFDQRITQWRDHPFQPHVVARGRIVAYMKWTAMTYIRALISYGDYYFRRRTLEDLPRAIQLYVVASSMYGPKGEMIPKQGKKTPQTYFSLLDKWDAFSNAAVQLELLFPFSNQTPFAWGVTQDSVTATAIPDMKDLALANIFGFATSTYFCLPTNPELQNLRTTIDTRLFNIRNCLDIDGKPMPLALWEPPIDPGQLVEAVASGLSLSSALNDLNASLPNYRFSWLISKAFEVCAELKSMEGMFLSIKEKRDGEALQRLRTSHEITMAQKSLEMKKIQLEEAVATVQTLVASQEVHAQGADVQPLGSGNPFKQFDITIEKPTTDGDLHMNSAEKEEADQAEEAQIWNYIAAGHEVVAGILHAVPSFNIHTTPMGCGLEIAWGMPNIASAVQATARMVQTIASHHSFKATEAARKAANIRQFQDRIHQMNLAGFEYEHINTQIAAQKIRIRLANKDIDNQQKLLDNANEIDQFLANKYTNDELYEYLESSTRQNMYQTYQLAFDLAKKAELAYRFERKVTNQPSFISFGYFNPGRDGLQSGQQLYLALKHMETAYQSERGYDFELTKSVSLRQLNPHALLTLRETGSCQIDLPEVLFDMDFPGHYFRRLKTVSLTVPCVVGPYTGVNATLRLLSHRYRWNPVSTGSGKDYLERMEGKLDDRFRTDHVPIEAIAASTGQNDSGVFELSIRDERYLPFEGAGAVGSWFLQLPSFPQFDYNSIADVILTIRYTACDGGMMLRKAAAESVTNFVATIEGYSQSQGLMTLFDLRSEFAGEWTKLVRSVNAANNNGSSSSSTPSQTLLVLRDLNTRLPAFTRGRSAGSIRATDVSIVTTLKLQPQNLEICLDYVPPPPPPPTTTTNPPNGGVGGGGGSVDDTTNTYVTFDSGPTKIGKNLNMCRISDSIGEAGGAVGTWALRVSNIPSGSKIGDDSTRMWMIVRYTLR